MKVALLVLVAMFGCASRPTCPVAPQQANARPFVWRVSGPKGVLVIHATHQGTNVKDVSLVGWDALDRSQVYVAEADDAEGHRAGKPGEHMPQFHVPLWMSLRRMISQDEFRTLQRRTDVGPRDLERLKPWVAFMLLGRSVTQFPETSMSKSLIDRARSRKREIVFLDTWDDQASYLDAAITPRKLSAAIRDVDRLQCSIEGRVAAFRAGNDSVFANDITPGEPVVERIDRWFVRLRAIADDGRPAFAAVGIGQLVGPYGLLARFARDGYDVQRL